MSPVRFVRNLPGLYPILTQGLRPGLYSCAASRLFLVQFQHRDREKQPVCLTLLLRTKIAERLLRGTDEDICPYAVRGLRSDGRSPLLLLGGVGCRNLECRRSGSYVNDFAGAGIM